LPVNFRACIKEVLIANKSEKDLIDVTKNTIDDIKE
tara:strand:- start:382 stop:489 length:108 start_codon:yes stop_codon:yes gene_type:complete